MVNMITALCDRLIGYVDDHFSVVIVGGGICSLALVGLVLYGVITKSQSPVIQLTKTEWQCTGTKSESSTVYVQSGKVLVPVTTYHDVCVEYQRR